MLPSAAATAAAAHANAEASTAVTGEARPRDAGGMRAAIVLRRHLDVFVVLAPVSVPILDAQIGEMHLVVEVRQVVLVRPVADLLVASDPGGRRSRRGRDRARGASSGTRA